MSKPIALPSQALLLELFSYDPESGVVTRRTAPSNINKIGEIVGNDNGFGYLSVWVTNEHGARKQYRLHRLIWKMVTGEDPDILDHINGLRAGNQWANLRNAPGLTNLQNKRKQRNNKSGVAGVCWDEHNNRWVAFAGVNGRKMTRNCKSFEEAVRARQEFFSDIGFHANHGSERPRYPHPNDQLDHNAYLAATNPKRRYKRKPQLAPEQR